MNIHFGNPKAFFALFALIPTIIVTFAQWKRFNAVLGNFFSKQKSSAKTRIICRLICWSISWVLIVFALSSPYWGTKPVLVQTNGKAVSLVFDVSYSMTGTDGNSELTQTRLQVAQSLATTLVQESKNVAFSCVVAKGDGIIAVPLTEDVYSIENLIAHLSPKMISAPGTALNKGIESAIMSFPRQSSRKSYIVLFTDGDETLGSLQQSIEKAVSYGIQVVIVGVGSEQGIEVLTGDGITPAYTTFQRLKLSEICRSVNNSTNNIVENAVQLISGNSVSAAYKLYSTINSVFGGTTGTDLENTDGVVYEIKPINHYKLFVILSILFFVLGIIATELNIKNIKSIFTVTSLVCICFLNFGCSEKLTNTSKVLVGTMQWHNKNYNQAIAEFMQITENAKINNDEQLLQYGLFGLSSSYLMQDEDTIALEKLESIPENAPDNVKFATLYNIGIIAHKKGDYAKAISSFKEALLIDSTNVNAKINLELSLKEHNSLQETAQKEISSISESPYQSTVQDKLFSVIKESEQDKWKNSNTEQNNTNALDY